MVLQTDGSGSETAISPQVNLTPGSMSVTFIVSTEYEGSDFMSLAFKVSADVTISFSVDVEPDAQVNVDDVSIQLTGSIVSTLDEYMT